MRRKQLAKRVAIAVLSAATVMTSVPATAVFAAEVSIEASDVKLGENTLNVTVVSNLKGNVDVSETAENSLGKKLVNALNPVSSDYDVSGKTDADVVTGLQKLLSDSKDTDVKAAKVVSTTLGSGKGEGNVVIETADGDTYTITYTAQQGKLEKISDSTAYQLADNLDDYFADKTYYAYDGKNVNVAMIQADLDAAVADGTLNKAGWTKALTVTSATVADGKVTGRITVKPNDDSNKNTYYYDFTAAVSTTDESKTAETLAAAESIKNNTYRGTKDQVIAAIIADLKKALDDKYTPDVTAVDNLFTAAKHGTDGTITVIIAGKTYTFAVTEDSNQKLAEADKVIAKLGSTASKPDGIALKSKKDEIAGDATWREYKASSAFSRALQPRKSATAVDKDAVNTAVLKSVNDAIAAAGFDKDGVTYESSLVEGKVKDKDINREAKAKTPGYYIVKVTASIDNDFYDAAKDDAAEATSKKTYYFIVDTEALDDIKADSISLADQTVVLKKLDGRHVHTDAEGNSKDWETGDIVTIKPVITPTTANENLTWTIENTDEDGAEAFGTGSAYDHVTDKDKNLGNGTFFIYKPGTYTITVKGDTSKKEAKMTLTVLDSFKDVKKGTYYANAVNNAYALGVTNGVSSDEFGVNQNVSRAQFVTWLYNYAVSKDENVAIKDADVNINDTFSDVANTAYYAKAVQWASKNGIASGVGDGKFDPNADVTRAQAVTFIWRALGKPDSKATGTEGEATTQFTDVKQGAYYEAAVTWGVNTYDYNNVGGTTPVVSGLSTTTFGPDQTATRAQGISFIARAYGFYHSAN